MMHPLPICTVDADADGAGDKNDDGDDDDDDVMVVVVEWNSPELPPSKVACNCSRARLFPSLPKICKKGMPNMAKAMHAAPTPEQSVPNLKIGGEASAIAAAASKRLIATTTDGWEPPRFLFPLSLSLIFDLLSSHLLTLCSVLARLDS